MPVASESEQLIIQRRKSDAAVTYGVRRVSVKLLDRAIRRLRVRGIYFHPNDVSFARPHPLAGTETDGVGVKAVVNGVITNPLISTEPFFAYIATGLDENWPPRYWF